MPDLVAVRLPSVTAGVAAVARAWEAGAAVAVLDPHAPATVATDLLERLRPAALVHARPDGTGTRTTRLPDAVPVDTGTAAVVATSGSTGEPRLVVLSHDAMQAAADASRQRLDATPGVVRWVLCLPLHHVAGLQVLVRSWRAGTEPVVLARFGVDEVREALGEQARPPWLSLVPTMLHRLLDHGVDLAGVGVLLGGARADEALLAGARRAGARVVTTYGMTETCGGCVYDGVPLAGVEAAVRDDGRVRLRGPVLASGVRRPDGTVVPVVGDDGWLTTRDVGHLDGGRLVVTGRADAMIVTGGENVAAEAVEAVLRGVSGVRDAAVVGRPDPEWGHRVVAVVEADPSRPPDVARLREAVAASLGRAARPREVYVASSLPRTSLGKVARARVLAAITAGDVRRLS